MRRPKSIIMTITLGIILPAAVCLAQPELYYADLFNPDPSYGSIRRIDRDGNAHLVIDTGGGLRSIDIDRAAGKIYWIDVNVPVIRRANLDGSGQEDLVTTDLVFPAVLRLDTANGKMYWGDQLSARLYRANLDGSEIQWLRSTPFHRGIAIDTLNGKVYWSTSDADVRGKIMRSNLDGSTQEIVIDSTLPEFKPASIALDVAGGKIYWSDYVIDGVFRADLDGTNIEQLFDAGGNFNPRGVLLDLDAGKIYWGQDLEFSGPNGSIMRMNLDGSLPEVAVAGTGLAHDFAFGPDPDGCPADFDADGALTLADFIAFRDAYVAGDLAADFDSSGTLTLADFVAFRDAYVAGCP